jgi:hypothetical protein
MANIKYPILYEKEQTGAANNALTHFFENVKNAAGGINLSNVLNTPTAQNTAVTQTAITNKSSGSSSSKSGGSNSGSYTPVTATTTPSPTYSPSANLAAVEGILAQLEGNKPGEYQSKYLADLEALYNSIANREAFSYDPNEDPLYGTYKDKYTKAGQMSMLDTMANAAALTGGYGNSYAQTVGQQAFNEYMTALADVIPQLEAAAYGKWQDEGAAMLDRFGLLQSMDKEAYNRYRDTVGDYYNDLAYQYGKYQDTYANEYGQYLDALARWQDERDFNYAAAQDAIAAAGKSSGGSRSGSSSGSSSGSASDLDAVAFSLYDKYGASGATDTALSAYGLSGDAKTYVKNLVTSIVGSVANEKKSQSTLNSSKGKTNSATKKETSSKPASKLKR